VTDGVRTRDTWSHKAGIRSGTTADAEDSRGSVEGDPRDGSASPDVLPRPAAASDPVEAALADALTKASAAGRFDVVAQLARELEARRTARAGVVVLAEARERRKG
jgi:hypothetical protein